MLVSHDKQKKPRILSFSPTRLINSITHEPPCKILYIKNESRDMAVLKECITVPQIVKSNGKRDDFRWNSFIVTWTASSEFGTYSLCEQRRFRRACASAQSRQNLRCSLIQAVSQELPSDRKPDSWPLWKAGHAQLKFVMTECSKTQIRLTGLTCCWHVNIIIRII